MTYKVENLHALSHEQYICKNLVWDIRYCVIESTETLTLNLKGCTFWVSNEVRCNYKKVALHEGQQIHWLVDTNDQESIACASFLLEGHVVQIQKGRYS